MVNPKSELFDRHPDWVIRQPKRELELQRNQLTLDLTRPEVQQFEWKVIQDTLACRASPTPSGIATATSPNPAPRGWPPTASRISGLITCARFTRSWTAPPGPTRRPSSCSARRRRARDYGALKYFQEFWPSDNTDPVRRAAMQWDYSYFFPAMTLCSHVTHWGHRPMHFACTVAMSARFGMDLDLTKLPAEDKAVCGGAIRVYKQIRDVTHLGDLYRLENPHNAARGAINYASPDRFTSRGIRLSTPGRSGPARTSAGARSARQYVVRELNPAPGRAALPQETKTLTGEELMRDGVVPTCSKPWRLARSNLAVRRPPFGWHSRNRRAERSWIVYLHVNTSSVSGGSVVK